MYAFLEGCDFCVKLLHTVDKHKQLVLWLYGFQRCSIQFYQNHGPVNGKSYICVYLLRHHHWNSKQLSSIFDANALTFLVISASTTIDIIIRVNF